MPRSYANISDYEKERYIKKSEIKNDLLKDFLKFTGSESINKISNHF